MLSKNAGNAVDVLRKNYDDTPYVSMPFPLTPPDHLAAVAHLLKLSSPPVKTARVLELGCAAGGNLIPLAVRHPEIRAVGLDLSGVQIEMGKATVAALGLTNLELRQTDIGLLDNSTLGEFDYIICHGVYSWVPPHVQDAILRICKQNLAKDGIAYVSYNVYPGWKAKDVIRDAMLLHGNSRATPAERLNHAKGMIDFLAKVTPKDSAFAKILAQGVQDMGAHADHYLLHEYLEAFNEPIYFQEFIKRANGHDLGYLANSDIAPMIPKNYGPDVSEPLLKECDNQIKIEQYLDFVANRTFRQTLLIHKEREKDIHYKITPERYQALHLAAFLPGKNHPSILNTDREDYGTAGQILSVEFPSCKALVDVLNDAWPNTVAYQEIFALVRKRLDEGKIVLGQAALEAQVSGLIELLVFKGLLKIRLDAVQVNSAVDGCVNLNPAIRALAKLTQADKDCVTFNAWHNPLFLSTIERWLLPDLDGSNDRDALMALLTTHIKEGRITLLRDGKALFNLDEIMQEIPGHVDTMLNNLPKYGLVKTVAT